MSEWTETYKGHEVKVRKLKEPAIHPEHTRYRLEFDGKVVTQDWPSWARIEALVPSVVIHVRKFGGVI